MRKLAYVLVLLHFIISLNTFRLWKTYGCETVISTSNIATRDGCLSLIKEAEKLGPVGGIFNLAVALRDGIFANQTKTQFCESFAPKAFATQYLDELSRKHCPKLEHFVVFSSVSCGRGNAGQTNYGMANSIMERIIEDRAENGYPAKAIQWGAVGEVGLVADMAEDKIDMEIGGTLQQRISSCLQELDNLFRAPDAIVASMVVAEKRAGRLGNESITETVMNIMGIRDLKSVSLGTTLSEMGMDSLMAVEIKQTLERDFELILTPQDLRSLTFQKLQEYSDAREIDNSGAVKMILASEDLNLGMDMLLRNLGDESHCHDIMIPLKTAVSFNADNLPTTIIIPGLEGTAGLAWYKIAESINSKANVLQLHPFAHMCTIEEIAEATFEHVKSILKSNETFYIVAYSYGTYVSLHLAALLEKAGFNGQLLLIDGAPHFLTKLSRLHLGEFSKDTDLYDLLISCIINQIFPEKSKESTGIMFRMLSTVEEKIEKFMEFIHKQQIYSIEYSKTMLHAMFRRLRMAVDYNLDNVVSLKSPITLVRPAEVSLQDIDEDYCLKQVTSGKIVIKVIEGNHTSMLDNPALPQLINDFDPAFKDDKNFEEYIRLNKSEKHN